MRYAAPAPKANVRPAFTVEPLDGEYEAKVVRRDPKDGLVYETVKKPAGFLVRFPRGHSIRVTDYKELQRLGYADAIPIVDMDDMGEVIATIPNVSVKGK